jgi:3-oxoacyl-[acyl-carrier protein] reductase
MMDLKLDGKVALITGSSKGIGEAIAKGLAREKAIVVVHGRDRFQAERAARDISALGGRAHAVIGDLTIDDDVQRLVEEAQTVAGPIDILVNNAGGAGDAEDWSNSRPTSWASTYDSNVLAAVRISTRLLPAMRAANWGRIVNISSLAGCMPPATRPDYSACKAAMNAMTSSMAKAAAGDGVTVNAISPGTIKSGRLEAAFRKIARERGLAEDATWEAIEHVVLPLFAQVPLGRVGTLEEMADAVSFLASPRAAYITGVNLRLDGGMLPSI